VDMDQLLDKRAQEEVLLPPPPPLRLQVALRPLPPSNLLQVFIRQLHGFQLRLALTSSLDPLTILLFMRLYGKKKLWRSTDGCYLSLRASRVMITALLDSKYGCTVIVLGYLAQNSSNTLRIVPCGLNFFNRHQFRSQSYADFGVPITVPDNLVGVCRGGEAKKKGKKKKESSLHLFLCFRLPAAKERKGREVDRL
jgi:hypothetical protein